MVLFGVRFCKVIVTALIYTSTIDIQFSLHCLLMMLFFPLKMLLSNCQIVVITHTHVCDFNFVSLTYMFVFMPEPWSFYFQWPYKDFGIWNNNMPTIFKFVLLFWWSESPVVPNYFKAILSYFEEWDEGLIEITLDLSKVEGEIKICTILILPIQVQVLSFHFWMSLILF